MLALHWYWLGFRYIQHLCCSCFVLGPVDYQRSITMIKLLRACLYSQCTTRAGPMQYQSSVVLVFVQFRAQPKPIRNKVSNSFNSQARAARECPKVCRFRHIRARLVPTCADQSDRWAQAWFGATIGPCGMARRGGARKFISGLCRPRCFGWWGVGVSICFFDKHTISSASHRNYVAHLFGSRVRTGGMAIPQRGGAAQASKGPGPRPCEDSGMLALGAERAVSVEPPPAQCLPLPAFIFAAGKPHGPAPARAELPGASAGT